MESLTEISFRSIFGGLKWDTGGGFQLVFEPDATGEHGAVWMQTEEAEDDMWGRSFSLPHVKTKDDAEALKRLLSVNR
jgi:hypothetical protein